MCCLVTKQLGKYYTASFIQQHCRRSSLEYIWNWNLYVLKLQDRKRICSLKTIKYQSKAGRTSGTAECTFFAGVKSWATKTYFLQICLNEMQQFMFQLQLLQLLQQQLPPLTLIPLLILLLLLGLLLLMHLVLEHYFISVSIFKPESSLGTDPKL